MTAPLKPCPFCGGTDILPEMGTPAPYGLYCQTCKGAGPNVATDDPDPAIAAWNTRSDAPELQALVEAVREIVSDAWGYGHLFDTPFHAHVHDVLHEKLLAYEALQ